MRHGFDVSNPGALAVQGFDVAGGYLGGRTPHVWTRQQWDDQPARWRCMFWVYDSAYDPETAGQHAVAAAKAIGAPEGTIIFLDMETLIDPAWVNKFADTVHSEHHCTGVYGSTSTVFRNPVRSGYFVADPTGASHLYEHPHTIATQYGRTLVHPGGLEIDLDVFTDHCPLWDTRPEPAPTIPAWASDAVADLTSIATEALAVRTMIQRNIK